MSGLMQRLSRQFAEILGAQIKQFNLNLTKMMSRLYAEEVVEGSFEHALNEVAKE